MVSEVALALVLLSGAGLMVKSLWLMHASTAASAPDRVLTASLRITNPRFYDPAKRAGLLEDFLARVEALPGVRAAAASGNMTGLLRLEASAAAPVKTNFVQATAHYFAASGARLVKGRLFTADDRDGAPRVAMVNETLALRLVPRVSQRHARRPADIGAGGRALPPQRRIPPSSSAWWPTYAASWMRKWNPRYTCRRRRIRLADLS